MVLKGDDIRAEAIERVAKRWFEMDGRGWSGTHEEPLSAYRDEAAELIDAIRDLLPTGVEEWGWQRKTHSTPFLSTGQYVRYVTDWKQL